MGDEQVKEVEEGDVEDDTVAVFEEAGGDDPEETVEDVENTAEEVEDPGEEVVDRGLVGEEVGEHD